MKIYILELCYQEINVKNIIAGIYATYAVAKRKPERNSGLPEFEPWCLRYRCSALRKGNDNK